MTFLRAEAEGAACCNGRDRSWKSVNKFGRQAQPTNTSAQQLEHKDSRNQLSKLKPAEV